MGLPSPPLLGGASHDLGGASRDLGSASLCVAGFGGALLPGARSGRAAERNKQLFLAQAARKHGSGRNVLSQHDFSRPSLHWCLVSN
jgi:hypothetical protein